MAFKKIYTSSHSETIYLVCSTAVVVCNNKWAVYFSNLTTTVENARLGFGGNKIGEILLGLLFCVSCFVWNRFFLIVVFTYPVITRVPLAPMRVMLKICNSFDKKEHRITILIFRFHYLKST